MRKIPFIAGVFLASILVYVFSTHGEPAEKAASPAARTVAIALDQDNHATQFPTQGFVVTYVTGLFPNSTQQPPPYLLLSDANGFGGLLLPIHSGGPIETDQSFFSAPLSVSFAKGDTINIEARGLAKWHVNLYGYYQN